VDVNGLSESLVFGRKITGLVAADLGDESIVRELRDLWVRYGLIVFRDGQCDPDFQVALSRCFGELQVHAVKEMLHPERDELFVAKGGGTDSSLLEAFGYTRKSERKSGLRRKGGGDAGDGGTKPTP